MPPKAVPAIAKPIALPEASSGAISATVFHVTAGTPPAANL